STSSPTTSKARAVWTALPSGSKIAAISSSMASGSLKALKAGIAMYSAKAPGRLTPTPWVLRHRCRRPARQLRQWPQVMWPSPETRSPIWKPWTSWPISTTSPTYSWPTCMGTGIVRAAQSSHFQMWMSVPQMAVFRMRLSKSLCPMTGLGTSTSSNPAAGCTLAKALMKISERGPSGNDAQVAPDAGKGLDGPFDVLGRMGRAHLGADAGPAFGHYRIGKADHIDALVQQGIGHASGQGGIAQHHRDDRVLAGHQVETQGLHPAPE